MPEKPRIALYWCASCGGCDEAVVDLEEHILDIVNAVEIAFWPVAIDAKTSEIEQLPDGALLASFINGAVRNSEREEMARLLRRKSKYIVAFGACAQLGGIPGLANLFSRDEITSAVFREAATVEESTVLPRTNTLDGMHALVLPEFADRVRTLDQVIAVEYYIPGCPPSSKVILSALQGLVHGDLPTAGTVLAPDYALCEECSRRETKPEKLEIAEIHRPQEIEIDQEKCLLAQGILCMGPGTRAGCDAACVQGNMPCTGCFGPTSRVRDQGAKLISAFASNLAPMEAAEIDQVLSKLPDEIGTFYRYGLPGSLLQKAVSHSSK